MKSIFDPTDNQELIDRIHRLTPDSKPQWGKLNVSQMLYHCTCPLQVATGEMKIKRDVISFLFGKIAKRQLTNDNPFKRNLPTVKKFIPDPTRIFKDEQLILISIIKRFDAEGPNIITQEPHPFFGKLTAEEWDILQWKHLDHHLKQFSV